METDITSLKMMTNLDELDAFLSQMEAREIKPHYVSRPTIPNLYHQPGPRYAPQPGYFFANVNHENSVAVPKNPTYYHEPMVFPIDSPNGFQSSPIFHEQGQSSPHFAPMPRSIESYRDPRSIESYRDPRSIESYKDPMSREAHKNPRSIESYKNSRSMESYNNPRSMESIKSSVSTESYMNPRSMESYKNPRSLESYKDPASPESVISHSPSSVGSDPPTQFPMQYPYPPDGWFEDPPKSEILAGERCKVCSELAGKHSAYGGRVCPSCRAFFRRSVQTKYFEIFSCSKGEKCLITLATRKSCKYCRFKKCLAANMQVSWVLSDQERDRRFNKLKKITYRNDLTTSNFGGNQSPINFPKNVIQTPGPMSMFRTPEISFTMEETERLEVLREFFGSRAKSKYEYFFSCEQDVFQHLAQVSFFGGQVNYDLWKKFTEAGDQFAQETFLNIDVMQELTMNDRHSLIRANGLVTYSLIEATYVGEEDSGLCLGIKHALFSGQYLEMGNLIDLLKSLGMEDKTPLLKYDQIYITPWASTHQDEVQHRELITKIKAWVRGLQKPFQPVDGHIINLMKFIITFTNTKLRLERQDLSERIRHHYSMMLYRYLKSKFGTDADERFSEAMDTCANAREAAEILRRRLPI